MDQREIISRHMTGMLVKLDRRFRPATDESGRFFRTRFYNEPEGQGDWADLRKKRRTVILAEAGSGKTSEFRSQCADLKNGGDFAFYVTVAGLAKVGFETALLPADRNLFRSWKEKPEAECWIFVDSVDEAKDQGHHFEDAARNLEAAIAGRETCCHLYISSRYTDWDKTADQLTLESWLSLPQPLPSPPDLEDEVRATLQNREKPKAEPVEEIAVLMLEPLGPDQVRLFAQGSGIGDTDKLLKTIDYENLWSFAKRPLDLGWMVDFWRSNNRLGTLREMIEESIKARLVDPDPRRRKLDPLEGEVASHALDRIGAGFLFCDKEALRIPTKEIDLATDDRSIAIEAMLPGWSDRKRLHLLGRPVFDPATLGRARLHNDNDGALRCFLAARWLEERLAMNCPIQTVFDILFVEVCGHRLVRPNMVQTSAWLAGRVPAIADELISRAPINLLSYGDPGSLPIATRVKAFEAVLEHEDQTDTQKLWFMEGGLRRFAHRELDPYISDWWFRAKDNEEARHLILRLIHVGRQHGGIAIVRAVAFDPEMDETSQRIAARALVDLGSHDDLAAYAAHILTHHTALERPIVIEAVDLLFPQALSVEDFFTLIDAAGVSDRDGYNSILPIGPQCPEGLTSPVDLTRFLEQVVARSGTLTGQHEDHPFRDAFASLACAAALQLLASHPDQIPDIVTDLTLLLSEHRPYSGFNDHWKTLLKAFNASPGRRRSSFWRTVEHARRHPMFSDTTDPNIWLVHHLGWPVAVNASDIDWLIEDVRGRAAPRDRLTALRAAHTIWHQHDTGEAALERIEAAAAADAQLRAQLAMWLSPPPPSPEMLAMAERHKALSREHEKRTEERDNSWIRLIGELRAKPDFFDSLTPQTEETVDSRLYHLWQFLLWRRQSRSHHAITSLDVVEPIFGPELTRRFGEALIAFAYAHKPSFQVETGSLQRPVKNFDTMALAGISLAAATIPDWAQHLDHDRAQLAAHLAIIEMNGLPAYLVPLAQAQPTVVKSVLIQAIRNQLKAADPQGNGMLDRLENADVTLAQLIAPELVHHLREHAHIPAVMLEKIISVLLRALPFPTTGLEKFSAERVASAADPLTAAYYLHLLFVLWGDSAVDVLRQKITSLASGDQVTLCCTLLPRLFGDRFHRTNAPPPVLSVPSLVELLLIAFEGVRPEEDIKRPSGDAYSPGPRDAAQEARNLIFDQILKTPGEATYAALIRLATGPRFGIDPDLLRIHAFRRAELDAKLAPWATGDVVIFERTSDSPATTTADLQFLARRRLEALEHDLINGRFAQGDTLQVLVDENAVQRWIADKLEARQAESYTVQRETHHAGEKEPDISLTSRHSGVDLPIEIKIVDGMTVPELEAALEVQLCGQYLRHASMRHGILLLVYQHARPQGWALTPGEPLVPFTNVLAHLRSLATQIRETTASGPQPIIVAIDVSNVVSLQKKRNAARARTTRKPDKKKPRVQN